MSDERTYETIFMARQPIFDSHNETWGYMMLFRDGDDAERAVFSDNSEATMNLVANLPLCGGLAGSKARLMIHFTPKDIIHGIPHAVPWANTVIVLEETTEPDEKLLTALRDYKEGEYEIAINNFEGKPGSERLAEMANFLIIDMHDKELEDLLSIATKAKKLGSAMTIAKRVETAEELSKAKDAGFSLFHGFFFKSLNSKADARSLPRK